MNPQKEEIKPCPWCGFTFCGAHSETITYYQDRELFAVGCDNCKKFARPRSTPQDAIAAWNLVAISAPTPEPRREEGNQVTKGE